jgi:hypothetical protein
MQDHDTRAISKDTLNIDLSGNDQAQGLLSGKKMGDMVNLKNVVGSIISMEDGKLGLQINEVEFSKGGKGLTQKEETVTPPAPDEDSPVLVLLGVPKDEERTEGGQRERDQNQAGNTIT